MKLSMTEVQAGWVNVPGDILTEQKPRGSQITSQHKQGFLELVMSRHKTRDTGAWALTEVPSHSSRKKNAPVPLAQRQKGFGFK